MDLESETSIGQYSHAYRKSRLRHLLAPTVVAVRKQLNVQRVRLYSLSPTSLSLNGELEIGGVRENFTRVRIPLETDVPSQQLIAQANPEPILFERGDDGTVSFQTIPERDGRQALDAMPYDLAALDRTTLRKWADIPLFTSNTHSGRPLLVGKLTVDNRWAKQDPLSIDVLRDAWASTDIENECRAAGAALGQHIGIGPDDSDEPAPSTTVGLQAYQKLLLDDLLRTTLVNMQADLEGPSQDEYLDRFRVYLTLTLHRQLFGELYESYSRGSTRRPVGYTEYLESKEGFRGATELGGVLAPFSDVIMLADGPNADECCQDLWKRVHSNRRDRTAPVLYFRHDECRDDTAKRARSAARRYHQLNTSFHSAEALDREGLGEHIDIPLLDTASSLIGKITVDRRWRGTALPALTQATGPATFCGRLIAHANRVAAIVQWIRDLATEEKAIQRLDATLDHMGKRPAESMLTSGLSF